MALLLVVPLVVPVPVSPLHPGHHLRRASLLRKPVGGAAETT